MDPDRLLRRIERRALVLTAIGAAIGYVVPGGGLAGAASVVAGALLAGVSYWALKRGVTGLADAVASRPPIAPLPDTDSAPVPARPQGIVVAILRYALLAGIAYVMIARLRLPPLGVLGGASVIVTAAAIELVRGRT